MADRRRAPRRSLFVALDDDKNELVDALEFLSAMRDFGAATLPSPFATSRLPRERASSRAPRPPRATVWDSRLDRCVISGMSQSQKIRFVFGVFDRAGKG